MLADNWSLQDVSRLLVDGPPTDDAETLVLTKGRHGTAPIPAAVTAIEGLFDLLTDIVLRDQILIDRNFTYAWDEQGTYSALLRQHIVKPYAFLDYRDRFTDTRSVILDRLLVKSSLREAQAKNEATSPRF